jgi:hypothetical protein
MKTSQSHAGRWMNAIAVKMPQAAIGFLVHDKHLAKPASGLGEHAAISQ